MACHAVQESFKYSTKSLAVAFAFALAFAFAPAPARVVVDTDRPALDHDPRETATTPRDAPRRRVPASPLAEATTRIRFEVWVDDDDDADDDAARVVVASANRRVVVVARTATRASVVAMRGIDARDMSRPRVTTN